MAVMAAAPAADGSGEGLADIGKQAAYLASLDTNVTPWKDRINRSSAISRKVRGGNYVQIATVSSDGKPRNRTVVFRGFLDPFAGNKEGRAGGEEAMRMISDARSEKVAQAQEGANPACEMVWWFAKTSEQYRIGGNLQFIGGDFEDPSGDAELTKELQIARKSQWGNLSDMAREQFYWTQPGLPHAPGPAPPSGGRDTIEGKVLPVPDTFLLMLLWPTHIKYLRLTDNFAQFDELGEDGWVAKRVNP
jgi:hypothetical protein